MHTKRILVIAGVIAASVVAVSVVAAVALDVARPGRLSFVDGSKMSGFSGNFGQRGMRSDGGFADGRGGSMKGDRTRGTRGSVNRSNCLADECLAVDGLDYPVGTLSDGAKQALNDALDDEYKALATYQAVLAKLGSVRPFIMISRAEEQHISSLKALFDKYGMTIPENSYLSKVDAPSTLPAACQIGVDAEMANATLYRDRLLPAVREYPNLTAVFTSLMDASQKRYLPAFDRCH